MRDVRGRYERSTSEVRVKYERSMREARVGSQVRGRKCE